ncbi:hypothetical protein K438DRAFT_1560277, partial [Mycena galopus ATCC 62051]
NEFGVYKVFPNRPSHDPDESIDLEDLCRAPEILVPDKSPRFPTSNPWFPFLNPTIARLMAWTHLGSTTKSVAEVDSLVHDVLLKDDFNTDDLTNFSAARENKRLDDSLAAAPDGDTPAAGDKWLRGSVKIKVPAPKVCVPEDNAFEFEVEGLVYRPLLDTLTEAFQGPAFKEFHTTPFEYRWDPNYNPEDPDATMDVISSEVYMSPKFLRQYNSLPKSTEPHFENIIAAYMFWSDATHLANFGNASLWPLYTLWGNLSKYIRAKPTANAAQHQAYFPTVSCSFQASICSLTNLQLPNSFEDVYRTQFGAAPTAAVLTHLKRELMHRIWDLLLTPEFIHAWVHGIVIKCYDGVVRRIFPRFFTYGADYPEK